MRWLGLLLLVICLCGASLQAKTPQDLVAELPPCDSQNSAHREDVKSIIWLFDTIRGTDLDVSNASEINSIANAEWLLANLGIAGCAENFPLAAMVIMKFVAVVYEKADIQLDIGNSEDLAPLLEKWQEWATSFVSEELKTQIWLGSFSNYQGGGIEVGCESYLLPVDAGLARGRNTLAELSLALSALFDPARNHPAADVETEDWIKELGLSVAGIHIDEGMAEITLNGQLKGIGTCGDAILEAQILQTVFQFSDIVRAKITDGETNLWEIVDMSDRLSEEKRREYIYERENLNWLRD